MNKKITKLQMEYPNEQNYIEWRYLQGMPVGNLNTILEKLNEVVPAAEVSKAYVDKQDQSVLTTCRQELASAVETATQAITDLSNELVDEKTIREGVDEKLTNGINTLEETKQDSVSYISISGSSGTLTSEQIATLKSNNPRLNFVVRLNVVLKNVYYIAKQGVYAAAGESKIHVVDINFNTGAWTYKIYTMQPTLTAGTNITIKNNVISVSGITGTVAKDEQGIYVELGD